MKNALVSNVEGQQPFQVDQFSDAHAHTNAFEQMDSAWRERVDACAYEFGIDRSGILDGGCAKLS